MGFFKRSLFSVFIVTAIVLTQGCENDLSGPNGPGTLKEVVPDPKIYIAEAKENPHQLLVSNELDNIFTFEINYEGEEAPEEDIAVTFNVDPAMVDSFNTEHSLSYSILPEANYSLSQNEAVISAGETSTSPLELQVNTEPALESTEYLLPISLSTASSDIAIDSDFKTIYLVIKIKEDESLDIVITGIMVNPSGADSPAEGDTKEYSDGTIIVHDGGYEYIQLMALKDIDFSETPYSVVVGRNYVPHSEGWASGTTKSFKFNLTEGQASAGTFFYVGGAAKRIYGYSNDGKSTDISDANWIRALQTNLGGSGVAGDGFGESTSGLLTNSQDHATGIAVFKDTAITSLTIPMDAVFYGENVGNSLNYDGGTTNGYRVPAKSDLYSMYHPDTNEEQFLFGQGSNTYMVGEVMTGGFAQMGGVFNSDGVVEAREWTVIDMQITSELTDIEGGPGATLFQE